jgi:hypothetical protein
MDAEVTLLQVISKMNFNVLHQTEATQLPIAERQARNLRRKLRLSGKVASDLRKKGITVKQWYLLAVRRKRLSRPPTRPAPTSLPSSTLRAEVDYPLGHRQRY